MSASQASAGTSGLAGLRRDRLLPGKSASSSPPFRDAWSASLAAWAWAWAACTTACWEAAWWPECNADEEDEEDEEEEEEDDDDRMALAFCKCPGRDSDMWGSPAAASATASASAPLITIMYLLRVRRGIFFTLLLARASSAFLGSRRWRDCWYSSLRIVRTNSSSPSDTAVRTFSNTVSSSERGRPARSRNPCPFRERSFSLRM